MNKEQRTKKYRMAEPMNKEQRTKKYRMAEPMNRELRRSQALSNDRAEVLDSGFWILDSEFS